MLPALQTVPRLFNIFFSTFSSSNTENALSGLFREHLLSCFLEIRATLIIKLLFCVRRSSLSLSVLQRLRVLVLVSRWSLLHTHHCTCISTLPWVISYSTHSSVHSRIHSLWTCSSYSTLSWYNRRLRNCCSLNFWLFPYLWIFHIYKYTFVLIPFFMDFF